MKRGQFSYIFIALVHLLCSINTVNAKWVKKAQFQSYATGADVVLSFSYPIIAVGAPSSGENGPDSGEVCFYIYNEMKQQVTKSMCLRGSNPDDKYGQSVALSRSSSKNPKRVVIGAPGVTRSNNIFTSVGNEYDKVGAAYIYEYNESLDQWEFMEKISGIDKYQKFGSLVSISDDGKFIAVGNCPNSVGSTGAKTYSNRIQLYLYDDSLRRWMVLGSHSPSYAFFLTSGAYPVTFYPYTSTRDYPNTLSDISVLSIDDDDNISSRTYYVGFTSTNYYTDKHQSLARIYMYNNTFDEWDQISSDDSWFCYKYDTRGTPRFNFARNVLKLYSSGKSMNLLRGCDGMRNWDDERLSLKPYITLDIHNTTFDPNIDLPSDIKYDSASYKGFNLFLSDDSTVLAVYLNGAVYMYEFSAPMDKWVLSETITTASKAMAFSEGTLVLNGGGEIYQNANRKYTHENYKGQEDEVTASGKSSTSSAERSRRAGRGGQLLLFGFLAILTIGVVVYQLIYKQNGTSSHYCWSRTTSGVRRMMVTARLHRTNSSSVSTSTQGDTVGTTSNPNEVERMNLNQELQNMNRLIV